MTAELRAISEEYRKQGDTTAANFLDKAIKIGEDAGVLAEPLGLIMMNSEGEYLLGGPGIEGEENEEEKPVYKHPLFEHDRRDGRVRYGGTEERFTPTENDIVKVLEQTPNRLVTHITMNREVFGYTDFDSGELLKGHISSIKRKIPFWGEDGRHRVLGTVSGKGYFFKDSSIDPKVEKIVGIAQKKYDEVVYLHRLFELHVDQCMIRVNGRDITLTKLENALAEMLVVHSGWIVPTGKLMSAFDPNRYRDRTPNPSLLKTHMAHIRAKIKDGREIDEPIIEAKQDLGYRLNP